MNFGAYANTNKATKQKDEIDYKIIKHFGKLTSNEVWNKELNLISWNGKEPKFDLRSWSIDEYGERKMMKGITLTAEELQALFELLKQDE